MLHQGDGCQLEAIFSESQRILIEAPAGYGKTKTMVSKLAYLLASNKVPNPKRILALTFSVNGAYKIKKDVAEQIPLLLNGHSGYSPLKVGEKITVSNYHGFSRRILRLYGYLLHPALRSIDSFKVVDDSQAKSIHELKLGVNLDEALTLVKFNEAVRNINVEYANKSFRKYADIVLRYLVPNQHITYDAILVLTIILFRSFPKILLFYQKYYTVIIVDEFQDTNVLSWALLRLLFNDNCKVVLMGDSLQRIYGFIGALPKLLETAEQKYGMEKITLEKNYRFKDNLSMLKLDKNIRLNAENPFNPQIAENAEINLFVLDNQEEEAGWVASKIEDLRSQDSESQIAVLFRARAGNADIVVSELRARGIDFFYGLFTDEEPDYVFFHLKCLEEFNALIQDGKRVTKRLADRLIKNIENQFKAYKGNKETFSSLTQLLKIFLDRVITEYGFLEPEEQVSFVRDMLQSRALKQNMEYISSNVLLSTVHAAKGLEWSYVILADMEQCCFPTYMGLCSKCQTRDVVDGFCKFKLSVDREAEFLDELSVFYVGVTRAKKQVFFSASMERVNWKGDRFPTVISCFLGLKGISVC